MSLSIVPHTSASRYKVPLEITQKLRFKSSNNLKTLFFSSTGYLDQQTLRGVRELDRESAIELSKLLSSLVEVSSNQFSTLEPQNSFPDEIKNGKIYSGVPSYEVQCHEP